MKLPDKNIEQPAEDIDESLVESDVLHAIVEQTVQRVRSGPLPDAEELNAYNRVLPGLAERIVGHFEKEQDFRHEMNRAVAEREYSLKSRGQIMGLSALIAMLGVIAYMVAVGAADYAAILGGVTLVAVVSVFVLGKREDDNDAEE